MKRFLLAAWLALASFAVFAQTPPTIVVGGVTYSLCGDEGGTCTWSGGGNRVVAFGDVPPDSPSQMIIITSSAVPSGGGCFVGGLFNSDPAEGFDKHCWSAAGGSPPPAPTATLTASPTSVASGGASTLTLSSTNATSCTGPVSGTSGTAVVHPTSTTTYTETCSGATSPPATATATVTVTGSPPPAPTATLTASPTSIVAGSSSTLTWSSTNATSCSGVGSGTSGSVSVSPSVTTTYTQTCTGSTSPPATASATVTVTPAGGMCTGANTVPGGTPNGIITADTPTTDGLRVYQNGATFQLKFVTNVASADTVAWSAKSALGSTVTSGSFAVPAGTNTTTLNCATASAGYYAVTATTTGHGGALPARGTQPAGIATFGVLPPAGLVPAVTFASLDQKRIGMQGFNSNFPGLQALGASNVIDDDGQNTIDPTCSNTYVPSASHLSSFFTAHPSVTRIARLDGVPACNSQTGMFNDSYTLPANMTLWKSVMGKVGTEQEMIRQSNYPTQTNNYYQVTWEPSLQWPMSGPCTAGKNCPADFTTLYQGAYQSIHANDPNAVIMGPAEPFPNNNEAASGNRLQLSPGLCSWIDGVTTHGYYNAPTVPSNPPELQDGDPDSAVAANSLANLMKGLRGKMQTCKANMKLFETEVGISYDVGVGFTPSQNQLWAHAAVGARSHIIILGEGAQRTYYFFSTDIDGGELAGYGTFFGLTESGGGFDQSSLSPKPEAMAFATLSRVLEGTRTLGGYNLPTCVASAGCVHAYAFQQLNGGKVISALWFHQNSQWTGPSSYSQTVSSSFVLKVDAPGTSGTVDVIDMFGNKTCKTYANGQLTLTLTESPQYIVSNNPALTTSLVTVPVGYTGQ